MSEAKIIFSFYGQDITLIFSKNNKMKAVCLKYSYKLQKDINSLIFLYGGKQLDFGLSFNEQASSIDKQRNEMKVLVYKMGNYNNDKKFDDVISINDKVKDIVGGIKMQLDSIIKSSPQNKINLQLKNINYLLNGLDEDINKISDKLKNLSKDFSNNESQYMLESQLNDLRLKLEEERKKNQSLFEQNINLKKINNEYSSKIQKLENELKQKAKNERDNSLAFIDPKKIMVVNFVSMGSQIIHYSLPCLDTDLFIKLEEKLYEDFPMYKNYETYFEFCGRRIKRFKTLAQNGIKNNDIINVFVIDDY